MGDELDLVIPAVALVVDAYLTLRCPAVPIVDAYREDLPGSKRLIGLGLRFLLLFLVLLRLIQAYTLLFAHLLRAHAVRGLEKRAPHQDERDHSDNECDE